MAANQYLGAPVNFLIPWIILHYMSSTIQQNQKSWSQEISFENTSREDLNWQVGLLFANQDDIDGVATRFVDVPLGADKLHGYGHTNHLHM